uniref:Leucine zipper transcription factor-like protein 1 n=2 Tax=Cacopsylla melanoneura TaxID=428564 RepID=A0A8D8TBA8_9HEMI
MRLLEATYTQSEVSQLLNNLKQLVTLDIENELINVSHINCLLLKQLFTQAEKWYLYLNIDISEIQNKHLLEVVKSLDTASSNANEPSPTLAEIKTHKLQPLEQIHIEKISTILKSEIEKLKAANEMFVTQNEELKEENGKLKQQREMLNRMMDDKDKEMDKVVKERMSEDKVNTDNNVTNQKEVDTVLRDFEQVLSEQLSDELDRMKKEISKAQAQLQLAEEELERKFNQTMTYMNMKKMIQKKNDQVKQLRQSLNKYEPSDNIEEEME